MREQMNIRQIGAYRRQLLGTASIVGLLLYGVDASAAPPDSPNVWIEGGWHSEDIVGKDELFEPSFLTDLTENGFPSPARLEYPSPYSWGAEGKISLRPEGSNWVFSVSARYGRMKGRKYEHRETSPDPVHFIRPPSAVPATYTPLVGAYSDTKTSSEETHVIADFMVGRDVGLGLFSQRSTSNLNLGVRYAQFHSGASNELKGDPRYGLQFKYVPFIHGSVPSTRYYTLNRATEQSTRSFRGIGPTLEWSASTPVLGDPENGELAFDWGVNAAVLFGRQKADVQHETASTQHYGGLFNHGTKISHSSSPPQHRSRGVTVPNLGGFAGISYKFTRAKISAGYRVDYFFDAMDGGIDVRQSRNVGFFGPFATISIGLGG